MIIFYKDNCESMKGSKPEIIVIVCVFIREIVDEQCYALNDIS